MADEIISDRQAYAQGLKFYFTGRPCKRGHIAKRSLRTGLCVECPKASTAANCKAYRDRNREKILARNRERRKVNAETLNAQKRAYRKANPDAVRAWYGKQRAKKQAADGRYTGEDIQRIYKAQKGKCACCRAAVGKKYHVDHIQPLAKGGSNWPRNLQILCQPCNNQKHARDPLEFMQSRGLLL